MKMYKLTILPIMILLLAFLASATVQVDLPAANGVVSGSTYIINASTTQIASNMTFEFKCSNTNTTFVEIATNLTGANYTDAAHPVNMTYSTLFDTTTFSEDTSCSVRAYINRSVATADTNTGIIVDNSVPTEATGLESGTQDEESWTLSVVIDAKDTQTCTLSFQSGGWTDLALTIDRDEDTCSRTFTDAPGGIYHYKVLTSDGTNTTTPSAFTELEIENANRGGGASTMILSQNLQQKQRGKNMVMVLLLGAGLFLMFKKK